MLVEERIRESLEVKRLLLAEAQRIAALGRLLADACARGQKVFFFGNGGSAADAQHLAAELVCRLRRNRSAAAGVALTANASILTAIANDYDFSKVFARQIEALGRAGDVAVGLSTSGNSENVLEGVRKARQLGLVTVGLTGRGGGRLKDEVDHWLGVPSDDTARIQEALLLIGHILCEIIEEAITGGA
jgi:D-sedoheptulose 7-phosphate isomerase